ncbi:MAG: hypothetical protein II763_03680, partial [Bacteroidales bacterium]|nr:hypothetical protein [Bacteroidales bacterium]
RGGMSIDACSENSKKLYLTGGTVIALGSPENGFSASGVSAYSAGTASANTWYGITSGSASYAVRTPSSLTSTAMYVIGTATPTLLKAPSYSGGTEIFAGSGYRDCSLSGGSSVSLSAYSGGGGHGGGPGGGGRPW